MDDDRYACLKLENQLCFPLYACSKEVVRRYRPLLERLDLTYTQYIAMMVLWEEREISMNDLGGRLFLDSGTLTPLLKSLEEKGYVSRSRLKTDERVVIVNVTDKGIRLREEALSVPGQMASCISLSPEDGLKLYELLYKVLDQFKERSQDRDAPGPDRSDISIPRTCGGYPTAFPSLPSAYPWIWNPRLMCQTTFRSIL